MKIKKIILILFVAVLVLNSCQKQMVFDNAQVESFKLDKNRTIRSQDEVKSIVMGVFHSTLRFKKSTNYSGEETSMQISALTSDVLGDFSVRKDTLLYLVKNTGLSNSVVISANIECEPVIAIFENENISIDDLILDTTDTDNPFMPILLSAIEYNKDPESFDKYQLETTEPFLESSAKSSLKSGFKTVVEEVVPRVLVQWGQSQDPYTRYTPNHWYAGCVATVVAQALSVTKHLNSFNGIQLDWNNLIKMKNSTYVSQFPNEANTIGLLMRQIGNAIGMDYRSSGSNANTKNALKMFFSGKLNPYFVNPSKGAIQLGLNEHPTNVTVISSRNKKSSWLGFARGSGHAYIVDGYKIFSDGSDLVHVNFGYDHWYYIGYFMTRLWAPYFVDNSPAKFPYSMDVFNIRKK